MDIDSFNSSPQSDELDPIILNHHRGMLWTDLTLELAQKRYDREIVLEPQESNIKSLPQKCNEKKKG